MLHGAELAEHVAARLVDAKAAERVLVMQMPRWSSRSPDAPVALGVVRGDAWHILASIDTWSVFASPPPPLASRFARTWSWSGDAGPDVAALGRDLAALAIAWWESAPDAVGVLDVTGALTNAATTALGTQHGALGNLVYTDPKRGEAELTVRCGIGRERDKPRWPQIADIYVDAEGLGVWLTAGDGSHTRVTVRTVGELASLLPSMVATMRSADDACAAWMRRLGVVQHAVGVLRERLPSLVDGAAWAAVDPFEVDLTKPPLVVLTTAAPAGGTAALHAMPLDGCEEGVRFLVGRDPPIDVRDLSSLGPAVDGLMSALVRESRILRAHRLVEDRRYRAKRDFGEAQAGDMVTFVELTEVRPSGVDAWRFNFERAAGGKRGSIWLLAGKPSDEAILESLDDYLVAVD